MPYRNPEQQRRANRAAQRRRRDRQKEQAFELEEEQYENATLRASPTTGRRNPHLSQRAAPVCQ